MKEKQSSTTEQSVGVVMLPYYGLASWKLGQLLNKTGFKRVFQSGFRIKHLLRGVKYNLGLRVPGVYRIPCGACYIDQTGRTLLA